MAVPGVLSVGEPVSRVLDRLRSVMGRPDAAGVELAQGEEQIAVDLSIVASPARPVRETAAAVQSAATAQLQLTGREVAEVNVEVLDVAASESASSTGSTLGGLQGGSGAPEAPSLEPTGSASVPGHIRVSSRALRSAALLVAAESFGVPAARVGVALGDEAGSLSLRLTLPVPLEPLRARPATEPSTPSGLPSVPPPAPPLSQRVETLRRALKQRYELLTGTSVARVDVGITGVLLASQTPGQDDTFGAGTPEEGRG